LRFVAALALMTACSKQEAASTDAAAPALTPTLLRPTPLLPPHGRPRPRRTCRRGTAAGAVLRLMPLRPRRLRPAKRSIDYRFEPTG